MTILYRSVLLSVALLFAGCATQMGGPGMETRAADVGAEDNVLTLTQPKQADKFLPGPVEVCLDIRGYTVEPAKKGVHEGAGHHHLLVDVPIPSDLSQPLPKDAHHIHMGDGSTCKTIELDRGVHTIRGLFAKGNHVPYDPPITDAVVVFVGHAL